VFFFKSYWTTGRSHLRSEWTHFQPFKYRRKAESSELYSQPFKEVQATFHGKPLLQCTQITNRDPNTHIQRGKRINETMSFQPKSFTVLNQVVHCLIITRTHTHIRSSPIRNLPRCDRTEQCPDKTLETVHTKLLSSFWPSNQGRSVTSGKIEWANLPVPAESHFACHALINAGLAKLWWKSPGDNDLSKKVVRNLKVKKLNKFKCLH
jgi:hypothetical protein